MTFVGRFGWLLFGFLVFAIAERLYERRFSRQAKRGEVKMLWSYAAFHILHAVIYVGTAVEYFLRRPVVNVSVVVLGLILFAISLAVRLTAIRTLGRFWSLNLEIRGDHQLVAKGFIDTCVTRHIRQSCWKSFRFRWWEMRGGRWRFPSAFISRCC